MLSSTISSVDQKKHSIHLRKCGYDVDKQWRRTLPLCYRWRARSLSRMQPVETGSLAKPVCLCSCSTPYPWTSPCQGTSPGPTPSSLRWLPRTLWITTRRAACRCLRRGFFHLLGNSRHMIQSVQLLSKGIVREPLKIRSSLFVSSVCSNRGSGWSLSPDTNARPMGEFSGFYKTHLEQPLEPTHWFCRKNKKQKKQ